MAVDSNNKVYYCLSHDVVTGDVDRDVLTTYCFISRRSAVIGAMFPCSGE